MRLGRLSALLPLGAVLLGSALLGLVSPPAAGAADIRERSIKVGIGLSADHPQGQSVRHFADLVAQKSEGKLKVRLFADGSVGNDVTMISALQGGTLEMTVPDTSTLVGTAGLKEFGLINLPFMLSSNAEADAILDGPFGQKLLSKLPERGLVGLGFWENGFRQTTNSRRPIAKAEDFAGLKIRVIQNPLFIETFRTLGANASPLPFPEVYTALEQRVVDGQENPLATILASKFYEAQKYVTVSNHIYSTWVFLMSKRFWDRLTPDERRIISEAAEEAKAFERRTIREFDAKALADLKARGMEATTLPEAEVAKLREKTRPVWERFTKEFGEEGFGEMQAALTQARAAK